MIDKEILDQFQMLVGMMERMEARILTKDDIEPLTDRSASKTATLVEEKIGKRIDSLFDGYKLSHEKQYELEREFERRTMEMQDQIDNLQSRLAMLEKRIAG